MLEMTSNASTIEGKHVTSNVASEHSQQNTKYLIGPNVRYDIT